MEVKIYCLIINILVHRQNECLAYHGSMSDGSGTKG